MTAIAVTGVRKAFGARRVLAGVDLDVAAGSITAVLGPSGCGKTTLLRIIAGFETPDDGTVVIGDEAVVAPGVWISAHRRRVGLMPQEGALFPHLSAEGNVAFGIAGATRSETRVQAAHWLDVVGLGDLAEARPHELSGGQQQRVALARALAARPQVILLDEPFAALDAGLRVRVREEIAAVLRRTETTAILVTHDQSEALSLADSVLLLRDGVAAQTGTPADLYRRPATLDVARFVGATVELTGDAVAGSVRTALGVHMSVLDVPDGAVTVVLRPEQVRLDGGAGTRAGVTDRRFYGSDTVVHVALGDDTVVALRCPGDAGVRPGDDVTVAVDGPVLAYPRSVRRPPAVHQK